MAIDLESLFLRMAALEKEALASLSVTADAVPYFFHQQEAYPYWTNRLGTIEVDADSEDLDLFRVEIIGRLLIGQVTDGIVRGENEARLQVYIPTVIQWINERELAQSATYPTALDNLVRVRVTDCRGYTEFAAGSTAQVGTEFTFLAEFEEPIEQAYL